MGGEERVSEKKYFYLQVMDMTQMKNFAHPPNTTRTPAHTPPPLPPSLRTTVGSCTHLLANKHADVVGDAKSGGHNNTPAGQGSEPIAQHRLVVPEHRSLKEPGGVGVDGWEGAGAQTLCERGDRDCKAGERVKYWWQSSEVAMVDSPDIALPHFSLCIGTHGGTNSVGSRQPKRRGVKHAVDRDARSEMEGGALMAVNCVLVGGVYVHCDGELRAPGCVGEGGHGQQATAG